jgi:predicted dehydrogenase
MANLQVQRVGVVGCGRHGHSMAQAVVRSGAFRLVACADPDERAASRAAALAPDVSTHPSVEALLADHEVDALVVATPHHLLAPVTLAGLRAGKHVLAEKPIALDAREAAEIERAAARAGVCFMAGYSFRFSMARYVHKLLAEGVVGEICAITGSIAVGPMDVGWTARPETGGGPLLYVGSHLVDMALWFLGDAPTAVYADLQRTPDTGIDDTTMIQLRFARGAVAQFLVRQGASSFVFEFTVEGRAGRIALRARNFLQFDIEVLSSAVAAYQEPTTIHPMARLDNITMMLVPELEEFSNAIREGRAPSITALDGRRVLAVLDAVIESGRSGRPVPLDLGGEWRSK